MYVFSLTIISGCVGEDFSTMRVEIIPVYTFCVVCILHKDADAGPEINLDISFTLSFTASGGRRAAMHA